VLGSAGWWSGLGECWSQVGAAGCLHVSVFGLIEERRPSWNDSFGEGMKGERRDGVV